MEPQHQIADTGLSVLACHYLHLWSWISLLSVSPSIKGKAHKIIFKPCTLLTSYDLLSDSKFFSGLGGKFSLLEVLKQGSHEYLCLPGGKNRQSPSCVHLPTECLGSAPSCSASSPRLPSRLTLRVRISYPWQKCHQYYLMHVLYR
jgi:hypothetical protein